MTIPRINMTAIQGLPFTFFIPVLDFDGNVIDATGDTFSSVMATWGGTTVATFATEYTLDDTHNPALKLSLTAVQTAAISPGIYRWDATTTDSVTADTLPIAIGEISVLDFASV